MRLANSFVIILAFALFSCKEQVTIITSEDASSRINYGVEKLSEGLSEAGFDVNHSNDPASANGKIIVVGQFDEEWMDPLVQNVSVSQKLAKEGFAIRATNDRIVIKGADATGALYGCLELAKIVQEQEGLPTDLDITDEPEMVLRGACIGLQKSTYLPGRKVYEYPYTPENFPWFYDKELWIEYLDMLAENRMNSLYLWNGHPFASLVKLEDYPYAVEVDDEAFRKNEEIFQFLTAEAEKRGIWVIQMFYNIIVSKPFAEHHGIVTQDRSRPITPLIADYTRKSIAAFIEKYPNVGLLVALGEAMNTYEDDVQWFTETIIPGVKDGLKALGRTDEPPIILRAHDTNAQMVMDEALPIYKNLYTTHKYNGESLTTYQPRGPWTQIHQDLSALGSVHISNVHILANLEPFRYGSPDFIQKSVKAMHEIHGANGLHLYPQASYWDWPYTADKAEPRLLQIDRDWIWYEAWARYAWDAYRDRDEEIEYWGEKLGEMYGAEDNGVDILTAYEETGEIAPKLLRRFGITEGNRQTLLLGMFMSQLVNPYKWRVYPGFYESCGPVGEILIEWAEKEWNDEPHVGETPPQIIREVVQHGEKAVTAIESAAPHVSKNKAEFERLRNDIHCYNTFANFFSEKVKAAMLVLRYSYSKDMADLEKAAPHLKKSLDHYRKLVELTEDTYLYANSMQTAQRRIPIGGDDGKNKTWAELLTHYEEEYTNFMNNMETLKKVRSGQLDQQVETIFKPVKVNVLNKDVKPYTIAEGQKVFSDKDHVIREYAEELKDLSGLAFPFEEQEDYGTSLEFETGQSVTVVVGYFSTDDNDYLSPPTLETNANANDRGQAEAIIANAMDIKGAPRVNVHTYRYEAGKHTLNLGKGAVLILGFADASQQVDQRDAAIGLGGDRNVDWLFY